jgi:hypothetical protein
MAFLLLYLMDEISGILTVCCYYYYAPYGVLILGVVAYAEQLVLLYLVYLSAFSGHFSTLEE